jgi:4-amino-4-deoxy-L-arabinose transferase-like glycosyltransferase
MRPYLVLSLLCALLYIPGIAAVPALDRDEARYMQPTRQMLETGDFIDIRLQDEPRYKKPIGIYWLQAGAVAVLGDIESRDAWPHRVPSVLGAWAAVLITFALGTRLFDRRAAFLGAALLGGSLGLVLEANQAKTDAVLLATIVASQAGLGLAYVSARRGKPPATFAWISGTAALFWIAQGVGFLIKAPLPQFIALMTIAALVIADRDWRWLRRLQPLRGILIAAVIALPWAVAIWIETNGAFFTTAIGVDLLPKMTGGQESHGAPPGYYAVLMLVFFWPGSLFAGPALVQVWRERLQPSVRFCLAWLIPAWIAFELIPTKLPHYVLPLYPALALLTAVAILAAVDRLRGPLHARWSRIWYGLWSVVGLILAVAAVAAPIALGEGFTPLSLLPAAAAIAASVVGLRLAVGHRLLAAVVAVLALGAIAQGAILQWIMPRASDMWVSQKIARAVVAAGAEAPVAIAGYSEPSAPFEMGTDTVLTTGGGAASHLLATPGSLAVVEQRQEQAFQEALGARAAEARPVATVSGLNYSKGQDVLFTIYEMSR